MYIKLNTAPVMHSDDLTWLPKAVFCIKRESARWSGFYGYAFGSLAVFRKNVAVVNCVRANKVLELVIAISNEQNI
jgi:hypothetical protein